MTHFLQSEYWQEFQEALGRTSVTDTGQGYTYRAYLERGKLNTRLYVPRGPEITDKEAVSQALLSLHQKAKRLGATLVRIEPTGDITSEMLKAAGLKKVFRVQPESTSIIKLDTPEQIIARMSATNRKLYRVFEARGLSLHVSHDPNDIEILLPLLHGVAATTGMSPYSDEYLSLQANTLFPTGSAKLFYVAFEKVPIAAAMVHEYDDTRYYAHVAADYEHRKLGAGNSLVTHMLVDACQSGFKRFDFCGIWPDASSAESKSHAGITAFKRSFGGEDVRYVGTWELPVNRLQYVAYDLLRHFAEKRS